MKMRMAIMATRNIRTLLIDTVSLTPFGIKGENVLFHVNRTFVRNVNKIKSDETFQ